MGSTDSIFNTYKIIYGLQLVAKYAAGEYWTWYKRSVLQLPLTVEGTSAINP